MFITVSFQGNDNKKEIDQLCSLVKEAGFDDFCFIRDIENYQHVFDNPKEEKIIRVLDKFGDRGVEEETFFKLISDGMIDGKNNTGLMSMYKDQLTDVTLSLEKKGAVKTELEGSGVRRYFLDDPERRSLYKLMKYYILGYKDKEISQKFKMSVAGIGAMKRILREEIKEIKN
jgi:hypothetical protein